MILMVSGRTDIVGFYMPWFMNRLKEGFVDVRNPYYEHQVSRIYFEDVDLIFFCTKNPIPLLKYIKDIKKPIYLHVTITPYKKDIEPNVPSKVEIIKSVKEISNIIGIENVVFRYDPIFINKNYTIDYHIRAFTKLTKELSGYVKTIFISFLDIYKNVLKHKEVLDYKELTEEDYKKIGLNFSQIAKSNDINVSTCSEEHNLIEYGFVKGECLSKATAYRLTLKTYPKWKARKNVNCNCCNMVDIGTYNTCNHLCKYCYANYSENKITKNRMKHNVNSSLLIGELDTLDKITVRKK